MATMPAIFPTGQPDAAGDWFSTSAGRAVLDSEQLLVREALGAHPGLPWLWLSPAVPAPDIAGRGLHLVRRGNELSGRVRCGCPLPLPSEAFGAVVLQHVLGARADDRDLLDETARVLAPGGYLWLVVLNPLTPYRWRWRGRGISSAEPLAWRRRLRDAGLSPDAVSRGVGPSWQPAPSAHIQDGPGLRAAYALRAQKRHLPLTPVRRPQAMSIPVTVPAV